MESEMLPIDQVFRTVHFHPCGEISARPKFTVFNQRYYAANPGLRHCAFSAPLP
jgi:hypothetical protein